MLVEDASAELVDFAKGHGAETAAAFQTKAEAAYSAEEVEQSVHLAGPSYVMVASGQMRRTATRKGLSHRPRRDDAGLCPAMP